MKLFRSLLFAGCLLADVAHLGAGLHLIRNATRPADAATTEKELWQQKEQESNLLLNGQIQAAADQVNASVSVATHDFLRSLRLCARCTDFWRHGPPGDGGYVTCADGLSGSSLSAVYSFGIKGVDGFGMAVASTYGLPVHEYDCFHTVAPAAWPGVKAVFHPECLKGNLVANGNPSFKTLTEHFRANGHLNAADNSILLKVDVEGSEWEFFAEEPPATLRKVRQIVAELHSTGDAAKHALYLKGMQNLQKAGFAVVHLHGNNNAKMAVFGNYQVPHVLEVTMIRKAPGSSEECPAGIPYRIHLDQPCNPSAPEMSDAKFPASAV